MVNSSQTKIVWRVDRRLKHSVVMSWPAPQTACCHCCDELTACCCRRRLECFVQQLHPSHSGACWCAITTRAHTEQLAIVDFLIRLCNGRLLSTILYPCRSSLCGNYRARATLVPWITEKLVWAAVADSHDHTLFCSLVQWAEHCMCFVVHFVFCSISCAFFE